MGGICVTLTRTKQQMVAYLELQKRIGTNFFVHFRLPEENRNVPIGFGFDWLRQEYLPETEGGKGICISDIDKLKAEYHRDERYPMEEVQNTLEIGNHRYYTTFLNIRPEEKVTLQLEREDLDELPKDYNPKITLESSNSISISPKEIRLKDLPKTKVQIYCVKPLQTPTEIKIKTETGNEVGNLTLMRNNIQYKLKVRFVEVAFRGSVIDDNEEAKNEYHFNMKSRKVHSKRLPNEKLEAPDMDTEGTIKGWKDYIKNNKELFRKLLNQSLISYDPERDIQKITVDFGFFYVGSPCISVSAENRIKKSIKSLNSETMVCDVGEFVKGLGECYEKVYSRSRGITVFLIPIRLSEPIVKNNQGKTIYDGTAHACSDSVFKEGHYVMLCDQEKLPKDTLIHEAGHTMGLLHSFPQGVNTRREIFHFFQKEKTDNLMDYTENNIQFWKWQWKLMQQDTIDLEII